MTIDFISKIESRLPELQIEALREGRDRNLLMATLYLVSGLPGSGKTTLAKELEQSVLALRLCPDEWVIAIMADVNDIPERDRLRDPIEAVQWELAKRVLALGRNVILEWGFWTRGERERYRREALALGHQVELHVLVVEREELWARLEKRNANLPPGALLVSKEEFDSWYHFFEPPTEQDLAGGRDVTV